MPTWLWFMLQANHHRLVGPRDFEMIYVRVPMGMYPRQAQHKKPPGPRVG